MRKKKKRKEEEEEGEEVEETKATSGQTDPVHKMLCSAASCHETLQHYYA